MNLPSIDALSQEQIIQIFHLSDLLQTGFDHSNVLSGKYFVLFFPDSSIRTRITFERGIQDLGGRCILFPSHSLDKKEEVSDVIQYISNWGDGIIVRHPQWDLIEQMSSYSGIPVINAMSDEEHPCEILSDLYSIRSLKSNYRELKYVFVGPSCNISKTWAKAATIMDLDYHHVCEAEQRLKDNDRNYQFHTDLHAALHNSDVILCDSLPPQFQNQQYIDQYQITLSSLRLSNPNSILNPCPPFFRGEEVHKDAIDSSYFVGHGFKKNLLYVQQAIILYCSGIALD